MGKSKKSAVAVQVPSFAASGLDKKKGKRGLEVASTLVSSTKKQKTAERHILSLKKVSPEETSESEEEQVPKVLIGKKGGPKTKALGKKAPAPESSEDESSDEPSKPVLKKEVAIQGKVGKGIAQFKNVNPAATESSDEDSESEDLKPSKPAVKKQPPGVQNPPAKESSDESSDDSESEEEIKNAEKTAAKSVKNVSKKKESSTDDSSDSDDEEEPTIKLVKAAGKPAAKPLPKKAESSDDDSSDESDDESDEEPQIKKNKIVPSTKLVKAAGKPVAKPLPKKAESSDEDSSEESDDESDEEPQIKKNKIMPAVKTPAKKVETSDEDDSSEESEEEDSGKELDSKKQKISGKPVVAPPSKKVESSDEDSSEESEEDSDEEPQIKKQKVAEKPEVKVPAKKKESSDEEDSSEDDSDEEPRSKKQKMAPIKASGKVAANGKTQTNGEEEEMQEQKTKFKNQKYENANEEVTPGRESSGGGSKTIFVKNLAWSVDEDTVAEFFQAAGEVKEVRLAMDGNQRFRGFGHVEFTTESGAKKACEKSGEPLAGREIYVDLAKDRLFSPSSGGKQDWNSPRSGGFGANDKQGGFRSGSDMTAFVRGFDKFQDEDSIRGGLQDFFSECGNIQGIRLPSDRETGQIKGFAYVEFSDKDALSKAVELNGADLNGRYLFIEAAGQGGGGGGRGDGGGRGGRGGRGGGRGDFGGGRGRGGGGGRGGGWGGRGGGAPRQKVNLAPSGTGKKTTFGDE